MTTTRIIVISQFRKVCSKIEKERGRENSGVKLGLTSVKEHSSKRP